MRKTISARILEGSSETYLLLQAVCLQRPQLEKEGSAITALKPIENRRVRAVASERYPINDVCAHPECAEPTADPHHIFPRSLIAGDSWFVEISWDDPERMRAALGKEPAYPVNLIGSTPPVGVAMIPHVTGLCREHHDDVEEHQAWIKLEDGEFVWYNRADNDPVRRPLDERVEWDRFGPLNPQPGSRTGKPKRRKFKGEARRKRTTISVKVPKDEQEDGAGLWDEAIEQLEIKMYGENGRPPYYTIMDALNYTLLNAGEDDFNREEK